MSGRISSFKEIPYSTAATTSFSKSSRQVRRKTGDVRSLDFLAVIEVFVCMKVLTPVIKNKSAPSLEVNCMQSNKHVFFLFSLV